MNNFHFSSALMALIFLTGCGIFVPSDDWNRDGTRTERTDNERPRNTGNNDRYSGDGTETLRNQIINDAASLIGTKYRYGGVNPSSGMDCSGLMNYVFQNVGITLRRSSREQVKDGENIRKRDARPGDLVFFSKGGQVFHVALIVDYDGEDRMEVIHSTSSKGIIRQEILNNSYWTPKISSYRNVIGG
ncbi:hypothetical protein CEQ90_11555 [Lewinellaceae bacterium SD302]|nr:hypothetical protein CEQ90_11555 [Lewinellaceae bacterium SD302]